jgi:hypothetical protein
MASKSSPAPAGPPNSRSKSPESPVASTSSEYATNAIAVIPQKGAFDEATKQLCFEIWLFLADRNAEDTVRILTERLQNVAPEEFPQDLRIPSVRTVQNWAKTEGWAYKANDLIRNTAEHIDETQIARLFVISEEAIGFAHRLIRGDFDKFGSPGVLAVRWDAAKEMLKFRGLGTAGVVGAPTLEVKIQTQSDSTRDMSVDEISEHLRQKTLEKKEQKRLTGRSS